MAYDGGETRYLLSDGLGSVRQAVDDTGAVMAYNEFDPYGSPVQTGEEPYGYTGEWWEEEVALLHLRARWYLPETGTFLSRDAIESEPPYLYVRGNPVNLTDPSGFCPEGENCYKWIDLIWQRFQILVDAHFMPQGEINAMQALNAYKGRNLACEDNLWTEQELATLYLGIEMMQRFLPQQHYVHVSRTNIRRVHTGVDNFGNQTTVFAATTHMNDPRPNVSGNRKGMAPLTGPVIELPTGTFHQNGGNGGLQPQGVAYHTTLHELFHAYDFQHGDISTLRSFGRSADWDMISDFNIRRLCNQQNVPCDDPFWYRIVFLSNSSKPLDSPVHLTDYGSGRTRDPQTGNLNRNTLHEDFAETSAQFAELWLIQNGYPFAQDAYANRINDGRALDENKDLLPMVEWMEGHYGRSIQTQYPR